MLSERPNVAKSFALTDPLRMCPARVSAAGGRETPGVPFLGHPFFGHAKKGCENKRL